MHGHSQFQVVELETLANARRKIAKCWIAILRLRRRSLQNSSEYNIYAIDFGRYSGPFVNSN